MMSGRCEEMNGEEAEESMNLCPFTTLSTIAVQAGQSQTVISVLKSGSLVHLQLVQVQPGLCEVGSNQKENETLIQEQQQLLEKLKKHEAEVLAAVEKKAEESKRRSRGATEQRKKWEEEERLRFAMKASLTEGWSLLLHLFGRRLEVLKLASDFYHQASLFVASIDRFEGLQVKPGEDGLTATLLSYNTMRKDLLQKSLGVLTSSSILIQEILVLRRIEALQRKGEVLQVTEWKQVEEEEEEEEGSQRSRQVLLRLEELVEELQDRRRRADQAVGMQLRRMEETSTKIESDQRLSAQQDCSPTVLRIQEQNLQFESSPPVLLSKINAEETQDPNPGSRPNQSRSVEPRRRCENSRKFQSGATSDRKFEVEADQSPSLNSELSGDLNLQAGFSISKSHETADLHSGLGPKMDQDVGLDPISESRQLQATDQRSNWRSDETENQQAGSRSVGPKVHRLLTMSRSDECRNFSLGFESSLKLHSRSQNREEKTLRTRTEETKDLKTGSRMDTELKSNSEGANESDVRKNLKNRCRTEGNPAFGFNLKPNSGSETSLNAGSGSEETRKPELILKLEETKNLESGFRPKAEVQSESGSHENPRFRSEDKSRSSLQPEDVRKPEVSIKENQNSPAAATRPLADLLITMEDGAPDEKGHAHCLLLTNQPQPFLSSLEWLQKKVCSWMQLLSDTWKSGWRLSEAEHTLRTHLQLQKHILSADQDVESWKKILHPNKKTNKTGDASRQISSLKALTERLRGGCARTPSGTSNVQQTPPAPQSAGDADRVERVLKELQDLRKKTNCRLQLLQPYVCLLRTAQQVDEEMKELREHFRRRREGDEEEAEPAQSKIKTLWLEMMKKMGAAEELGDNCIRAVTVESELASQTVLLVVQQTMKKMGETKLEMKKLKDQEEDVMLCREYQERLNKTLQDLKCVSELLDSCTFVDLGLDLNTFKLLEHFRQARPHFNQLDAEVESMLKSWQSVKLISDRLKKMRGDMVEDGDLSKMVKLQETVKNKIQQSESILELTSRFHVSAKQLEELLHTEFSRTSTGSSDTELSWHNERRQQIQHLLKTTTAVAGDICAAVKSTGWMCFRVEQLEARLLSLDSLCRLWLKEAARHEEELRRDQLTHLLHDSINQVWDSFKELKKCFSNTRFNYLKRNNRTRNLKVVRNQLQQVEVYGEKLQTIRKRVHGVEAQLSLQVKDGVMVQQVEDTINELQKQMGELEHSFCEHQKTLDMTCRLHQAMQEYQFWCEEASSTITRVVKFSTECCSAKAVSTLHRQLEKFVWPTVPEQEERISQITELAEKLYGVEEGQRYVEKTIKKHCDIVASIRELSRQLVELEAKLKIDKEETQEGENEERLTEKRSVNKQRDNRSTEEDDRMSELKETGHTPEVTAEDDWKEALLGKEREAKREASFQKTLHEDGIGSFTQCFSHSSIISCSPTKTNRRANTVHSQSQAATTQPQVTTSTSQKIHGMGKAATSCGINITSAQNTSAEVELQQDETTEDCLSNDEYDCASPDDISLPPLAETPESTMFQSDVEETLCISSHSLHVSRFSCQGQSELTAAGADTGSVPQQSHSNPTDSSSSPSVSLYSSTSRIKAESSSFVQSLLTLPAPRLFTSTLCTTLTTSEICSDIISTSAEQSIGSSKPSPDLVKPGSNPVQRWNSADCSLDSDVPEMKSVQPSRKNKNAPNSEALHLNSTCLQPLSDPHSDLHKCRIHPEDAGFNNSNCTCPQSKRVTCKNTDLAQLLSDQEIILHLDRKYSQNPKKSTAEANTVSNRASSAVQQNMLDCHSNVRPCRNNVSPESCHLTQVKRLAESQNSTSSVHEKPTSNPQDRNSSTTVPQSSKVALQIHLPQSIGSRSGLVQKVLPFQNEASTDSTPRTKSCTTAPIIKHSVESKTSPEDIFKLNKFLNPNITDTQKDYIHSSPESECVSNTSVCSSNRVSMEQSLQTVCSLNESKSTTHVPHCMHGHSMSHSSPAKPTAPPQAEAQTQALSQQVNPHVSCPAPPHPLTPHQDSDICLPIVVREEIRLTPQIEGPPCTPGFPCCTRPVSQTAMIEGSPVMLEVEVMGHQEPKLTWLKEQEAPPPGDRGKHLLLLFEAMEAAGSLLGVQRDLKQPRGVEKRLLDLFDSTLDWYTWFGILCVLLWLLYLILL